MGLIDIAAYNPVELSNECYSFASHASTPGLVLKLLYVPALFILFVCLSVHTSHMCQLTSLCYYATVTTSAVEATGCLQAQ